MSLAAWNFIMHCRSSSVEAGDDDDDDDDDDERV